jgi:hypothetical protein
MKVVKSKSEREKNRQLERVQLEMFQINERCVFWFSEKPLYLFSDVKSKPLNKKSPHLRAFLKLIHFTF